MRSLSVDVTKRSSWNPIRHFKATIRSKILFALFIVAVLMTAPYIFLIIPALQYNYQYDMLIHNIALANSINAHTKQQIDAEMWEIIAGKSNFHDGEPYAILDAVDAQIWQMQNNTTSERGHLKLTVVHRTLTTLRDEINALGRDLDAGAHFDESLVHLERIRMISQLLEDDVQDYALFEVERTQQEYAEMKDSLTRWAIGGSVMMVTSIIFSITAAWRISHSVYAPIKRLHDVTTTIAQQDLEVLVTSENTDEITELVGSFNAMVRRIRELLAAKVQEQQNLKKAELRALQAQINPHFLYNTLDAIIWMAEAKRTDQVVDLVSALSRFFRITLSKGKDWISMREEIEHVSSYLAIQKMRYRDIVDYTIDIPADMLDTRMLKLTLQPLVENALYHGVKNKRSGGQIAVRGRWAQGDLRIDVLDNGIGIAPERLRDLTAMLERDVPLPGETSYGMHNVNQRIKLFYGQQYGIQITSEYLTGTCVSLLLPTQKHSQPFLQ